MRNTKEKNKKNPMINFADSVNRAQVGDLRGLTQGGCLIFIACATSVFW